MSPYFIRVRADGIERCLDGNRSIERGDLQPVPVLGALAQAVFSGQSVAPGSRLGSQRTNFCDGFIAVLDYDSRSA